MYGLNTGYLRTEKRKCLEDAWNGYSENRGENN